MTKSLIRLDSIVRASLNNDCMTNRHDERQWDDNNDRTDNNTGITKGYNEWDWEDDSITNSYSGYSGYNEKLWSYNEKL